MSAALLELEMGVDAGHLARMFFFFLFFFPLLVCFPPPLEEASVLSRLAIFYQILNVLSYARSVFTFSICRLCPNLHHGHQPFEDPP